MKVNLAAKNDDVKDNDPSWNFNIGLKCIKYKDQQQKKCVHNNSGIAQCYQCTFQPGKRHHFTWASFMRLPFQVPKHQGNQKSKVE